MTETEYAYIAGIIDGEGSISAVINKRTSNASPSVRVLIDVWNTHEPLIALLHESFGGHVGVQDRKAEWKPVHFWRLSTGAVRKTLPHLIPHLRVKRDQAVLALALANRLETPHGERPKRISPEEMETRKRLVSEIQSFNKRGRST